MPSKWSKLFPQAKRGAAEFLIDGEQYFAAVVKAIESTKGQGDYVYILGWMLDLDFRLLEKDTSKTLFAVLKAAAERGVEIRILVWDNVLQNYARMLQGALPRLNKLPNTKAFADDHTYSPPKAVKAIQALALPISLLLNRFTARLFKLDENSDIPVVYYLAVILKKINNPTVGAHHEKNVIVRTKDGLQAFCGGMDINKNRAITKIRTGERWFPYYHDTACRVDGLAAYEILQRFKRRWQNHPQARGTSLRGANEFKPREAASGQPFVQVVGTYNSPDGKQTDRSFSEAFFKVIENAEKYIYIEDQYMVNLDVAHALNRVIKKPKFERLTLAIQASDETSDILIPNRKRDEFLDAVLDDASKQVKDKVLLALPDKRYWEKEQYHPGMHAKTLIVDDEIAIIGSANVNQRSFSVDSETSALVFDEGEKANAGFAYRFRSELFKHYFLVKPPAEFYEQWRILPALISSQADLKLMLVRYTRHNQLDLDERIINKIWLGSVLGAAAILYRTKSKLKAISVALSPIAIRLLFDQLFDTFIDPKAD